MAGEPTGTERTAAVLSIGDELTLGQSLDTNSAWIADRLVSLGLRVIEHATVDDEMDRLVAAFERLGSAADVLVCTGGLGPTADDLTRQALASVLGEELVEDAAALTALETWYRDRGRMPPGNRVQATRPESARMLENPNGTAPGLAARVERLGAEVFCLPGPPHEMRPMFERFVAGGLSSLTPGVVHGRLLLTFGMGESNVAELLGELMDRERPERGLPLIGTTASRGVVTVRMRHAAADEALARAALDEAEDEVRARLGAIVFERRDLASGESGEVKNGLAEAVVRVLADRGERLVVAESCTGGGLGAEITGVPGSSDVFAGGWLTYANEAKVSMLGVPGEVIEREGAVSRACAEAMAAGALERSQAMELETSHALAVTGIAGPGGGSEAKPVGTVWIGRASRDGDGVSVETRRFIFRGGRGAVREWSTRAALGMLRLHLEGIDMRLLGEQAEATPEWNKDGIPETASLAGLSLQEIEKRAIQQTLALTDGNREQAAQKLGIGERTLYRKLKEYGLS